MSTAHLNGDNHTVSGLNVNTSKSYQGLFAQCDGSILKNINLSVSQLSAGDYAGALVGKITNGTIANCHIIGNVSGGNYIGGLSGMASMTNITDCSVIGNVTGIDYVAGLVGKASSGSMSQSEYQGTVSSQTAGANVGGLIGLNSASVTQCHSAGSVVCSKSNSYVGGSIGLNSASVSNCYSTSEVISGKYGGGLIGFNSGPVEYSYALGNVTSSQVAGGLIGYNSGSSAVVSNCSAMNLEVNSTSSTGVAIRVIGGISSTAPTPEMNNYALKTMAVSVNGVSQKIYDDNLNGVAKADSLLRKKNTYVAMGWDMDNIWKIDERTSYPYLRCFVPVQTNLHLSDLNQEFTEGTYEDGIDYTRAVAANDEYATMCLPFAVQLFELTDVEKLFVPIGVCLFVNKVDSKSLLYGEKS